MMAMCTRCVPVVCPLCTRRVPVVCPLCTRCVPSSLPLRWRRLRWARPVAGSAAVAREFERIRAETLTRRVRRDTLCDDVTSMRQRMRKELDKSDATQFDLKQGNGGIGDIEFIVQFLVLREACHSSGLTGWSDNIRQLEALATANILSAADTELLAGVYREFRSRMHRLALAGKPRLVPRDEVAELAGKVRKIWQQVFGGD